MPDAAMVMGTAVVYTSAGLSHAQGQHAPVPSGIVASLVCFHRQARPTETVTLRVLGPRFLQWTYLLNVAACPTGCDNHAGGIETSFKVVPSSPGDRRFEYGPYYVVLFDHRVEFV